MLQSKSLQLSDYKEIQDGTRLIELTNSKFRTGQFYYPHPHRYWEYGSAIQSHLDHFGCNPVRVLDVGAGYGVLGPTLCTQMGASVEEAEIDQHIIDGRKALEIHNLKPFLCSALDLDPEIHGRYDAVYCISVIEHIRDWPTALRGLSSVLNLGGLLVVTTDYGQDLDRPWVNETERENKFTEKDILKFFDILRDEGFDFEADTKFHGAYVFDYTFYRIVARKKC